jgi:L,D-peptidoglycan transpeptidase YkuD (ErfK/YbiS/YcfS/YnhG family)
MTSEKPTTLRLSTAALALGLATTQMFVDAPSTAAGATARPSAETAARMSVLLPDRITVRSDVRQMVTVTSKGFASTGGTLRAWRRPASGEWQRIRRAIHVRLGYNGWVRAEQRKQSTGTTPAGKFTMPYAFGRWANPGADLPYRRVDGNDYWPYDRRDPATYNIYQRHKAKQSHWRSQYVERLNSYTKQYGYAIVVGFNLPKGVYYSQSRRQWVAREVADTRAGGGIFLHVNGPGQTAGCVSMTRVNMRWLVRWVNPHAHPRLVMGPRSYVVRQ